MAKKRIFLNYATVSPVSRVVYLAVKKYWEEFYKVGPPDVLWKYDPYSELLAEQAAILLNCHPSEITYTKNTSEAVIIASEALPLNPGDEILVLGEEYPANFLPWLKKQKDGVTIKVIPHLHGPEAVEMLTRSITANTKVITMSSAQYYDGYMADLAAVSKAAKAHGAYFFVDAVQTIGTRELDLEKIHIDMLACGGQKFLQAGPGIGFLYINKAIMHVLKDFKPGIRSITGYTQSSYTLKPGAERFQDGTQNLSGIVALHASLLSINAKGIKSIEAEYRSKLDQVKAILSKHEIRFIDHGSNQSNIVSVPVSTAIEAAAYLKNRGVYIKPIKNVARLSFIGTTPASDISAAAKLLRHYLDTSK